MSDSFKVGVPGGRWGNQSCADVATGGSEEISHVGYAGIGIILADSEPYDLSGYTGLRLSIETDDDVQIIIKTATGGLFGAWFAGNTTSDSLSRDVSFGSIGRGRQCCAESISDRFLDSASSTLEILL